MKSGGGLLSIMIGSTLNCTSHGPIQSIWWWVLPWSLSGWRPTGLTRKRCNFSILSIGTQSQRKGRKKTILVKNREQVPYEVRGKRTSFRRISCYGKSSMIVSLFLWLVDSWDDKINMQTGWDWINIDWQWNLFVPRVTTFVCKHLAA